MKVIPEKIIKSCNECPNFRNTAYKKFCTEKNTSPAYTEIADDCPLEDVPSKPRGQLMWVPVKESIENPYELKNGQIGITDPFEPRVLAKNHFNAGKDAVYAAMKPVDKEWIERISNAIFPKSQIHVNWTINRAISEYIEELK